MSTWLNAKSRLPSGQTPLFDADDTLWENNIYFERAITSFISYLDHRVYTAQEVRERLNQIERSTIKVRGYGLQSFRQSLVDCFEQLTAGPPNYEKMTEDKHQRIVSFANSIAEQEIELMHGVGETLPELADRHRCIMVTKGDLHEQTHKLDRSGLRNFFSAVEVLPEKHEDAYRSLGAHHGCDAAITWMIGNSPKSDINPALAAGLHAVFIPHDFTWVLEHEVINQPGPQQRLIELANFSDLSLYF